MVATLDWHADIMSAAGGSRTMPGPSCAGDGSAGGKLTRRAVSGCGGGGRLREALELGLHSLVDSVRGRLARTPTPSWHAVCVEATPGQKVQFEV